MANILDYIDWRGDLSFFRAGFNQVDNTILSLLSYIDLRDIVPPAGGGSISLHEAARLYFSKSEKEQAEEFHFQTALEVFQKAAESKRYGGILLSDYTDEIDREKESQFSALTIRLGKGKYFISFSGTDDSIVGWKENFNMSFVEATESQRKSVEYLHRTAGEHDGELRIGGHSKGGNLAVYASVCCKEEIRKRIKRIYNNDGPGFTKKMLDQAAYARLGTKILSLFPEGSVVGMCLEHEGDILVVKSKKGKLQHDPINWEVLGTSFIDAGELNESARFFHRTIGAWMKKMPPEQREEFVDAVFAALEEHNILKVEDLSSLSPDQFLALWKSGSEINQENQDIIGKGVKLFIGEGSHSVRERIREMIEKALPGKKNEENEA